MTDLRVIIFDVDGTLVDSQGHIMEAMRRAFADCELPLPPRSEIMTRIGMSLEWLMAEIAGHQHAEALRDAYYLHFRALREAKVDSPLYPGTEAMLQRLNAHPETLLAIATGKSTRGLDALVQTHGWHRLFVSRQTADTHPSKPHPSMINTILGDTGVTAAQAVMIGDTRFDMDMARAAGVASIGVPWGYQDATNMGADQVIAHWDELDAAIDKAIGEQK